MKVVLNLSVAEIKDLEVATRLAAERIEESRLNGDGLYNATEEKRARKLNKIFAVLRVWTRN